MAYLPKFIIWIHFWDIQSHMKRRWSLIGFTTGSKWATNDPEMFSLVGIVIYLSNLLIVTVMQLCWMWKPLSKLSGPRGRRIPQFRAFQGEKPLMEVGTCQHVVTGPRCCWFGGLTPKKARQLRIIQEWKNLEKHEKSQAGSPISGFTVFSVHTSESRWVVTFSATSVTVPGAPKLQSFKCKNRTPSSRSCARMGWKWFTFHGIIPERRGHSGGCDLETRLSGSKRRRDLMTIGYQSWWFIRSFWKLSFSLVKLVIWRCSPCSDTPNQSQTLHGRLDFGLDQFFLDQDSLIKFAPAEDWSPRCLQHPRTFTCQIFIVSVVTLAQPGWPSQAMGGPWWPVRSVRSWWVPMGLPIFTTKCCGRFQKTQLYNAI